MFHREEEIGIAYGREYTEGVYSPVDYSSMTDSDIKIIIVDDHPFVRQGMKKVIEQEMDLSVVYEAGSAEDAIRMISRDEPDVAIVDISMEHETSGLELIKTLRERFSKIKTVALSVHDDNISAERAFNAGVHGYIAKKEAPSAIIEAIRTVMKGKPFLCGNISKRVADMIMRQ
jgi:DNA-binding NarL/FixJ family response regulator